METDKPLISILMAVYEPQMDWLREQLQSLNEQTYPKLRLYIRDDCSPTVPFEEIRSCVKSCISAFPYDLRRNERNLGSNGTFERLTEEAEGEYFAYCDQDDIWLPDKLEKLKHCLNDSDVTMAYCDMSIIDHHGMQIADSLRDIRPRLAYVQGEGLAETYFFRNCTAGCSMLIRSEIAKRSMPFLQNTVCDHWLAILAAAWGEIRFVDRPLLQYRQHRHNQTGILTGVTDKESYQRVRLEPLRERLTEYEKRVAVSPDMREFIEGRVNGRILDIWRQRAYSSKEALFEIGMKFMPKWLFRCCLRRMK